MMYKVSNPSGGADIQTNFSGQEIILKVGESITVSDAAGEYLLRTFGFLVRTDTAVVPDEPVTSVPTATVSEETPDEKKARVKAEKAAAKEEKKRRKAEQAMVDESPPTVGDESATLEVPTEGKVE